MPCPLLSSVFERIMAESLIVDWLAEFEALETSQMKSFCAQNDETPEITSALFAILGERDRFTEVCTII